MTWCHLLLVLLVSCACSVRCWRVPALHRRQNRCGNRIRVNGNAIAIGSDAISASIVPSVQLYPLSCLAAGEGEIIRAGASDQTV